MLVRLLESSRVTIETVCSLFRLLSVMTLFDFLGFKASSELRRRFHLFLAVKSHPVCFPSVEDLLENGQ